MRFISRWAGTVVLALSASLAACSPSSPYKDAGRLGYGTPSVSSYVVGERYSTLQAELKRCERVGQPAPAGQTEGLAAACDQLRRTARNQPGNSVQPATLP